MDLLAARRQSPFRLVSLLDLIDFTLIQSSNQTPLAYRRTGSHTLSQLLFAHLTFAVLISTLEYRFQ